MSIRILVAAMSSLVLAACSTVSATDLGSDAYEVSNARRLSDYQEATVVSVRPVRIAGEASLAGTAGGAIAGAVLGNAVAKNGLGSTLGGFAGAMAGGAVEKRATAQTGQEIVIKLAGGQIKSVVQGTDQAFTVGESVFLANAGQAGWRVVKR